MDFPFQNGLSIKPLFQKRSLKKLSRSNKSWAAEFPQGLLLNLTRDMAFNFWVKHSSESLFSLSYDEVFGFKLIYLNIINFSIFLCQNVLPPICQGVRS